MVFGNVPFYIFSAKNIIDPNPLRIFHPFPSLVTRDGDLLKRRDRRRLKTGGLSFQTPPVSSSEGVTTTNYGGFETIIPGRIRRNEGHQRKERLRKLRPAPFKRRRPRPTTLAWPCFHNGRLRLRVRLTRNLRKATFYSTNCISWHLEMQRFAIFLPKTSRPPTPQNIPLIPKPCNSEYSTQVVVVTFSEDETGGV